MMDENHQTEKLKLRATFFNNVSIGLFLGGLLVPYLMIVQKSGTIVERLTGNDPLTFSEKANAFATLTAMAMAFTAAKRFRKLADETISLVDAPKKSKN